MEVCNMMDKKPENVLWIAERGTVIIADYCISASSLCANWCFRSWLQPGIRFCQD